VEDSAVVQTVLLTLTAARAAAGTVACPTHHGAVLLMGPDRRSLLDLAPRCVLPCHPARSDSLAASPCCYLYRRQSVLLPLLLLSRRQLTFSSLFSFGPSPMSLLPARGRHERSRATTASTSGAPRERRPALARALDTPPALDDTDERILAGALAVDRRSAAASAWRRLTSRTSGRRLRLTVPSPPRLSSPSTRWPTGHRCGDCAGSWPTSTHAGGDLRSRRARRRRPFLACLRSVTAPADADA